MKNYKYLILTLLIVLVLLLLVKNKNLKSNLVNVDENLVIQSEEINEPLPDIQTIKVLAEGGRFTPSTINVQHLTPVILQITAVDKDYKFVQKELGWNEEIPMGQTAELRLDDSVLVVGEYKYTCGVGCTGEIISTSANESDVQVD